MDALVRAAVFGEGDEKEHARWLIWEIGQAVGVRPASIHDLYMARGRGEVHGFTVPAINVRGMSYDTARAIFRTAIAMKAGAFILEIARSEIAYTDQRPAEYVAVMLAAALREGFRGPVFIQGDHFQVNVKKYAVDPETEVDAVKALAREAIAAGFYNIDIDTSTLVDLSKPTLDEQQRLNYEVGVDILRDGARARAEGRDDLRRRRDRRSRHGEHHRRRAARLHGRLQSRRCPKGMDGLSKISVQSGTSHGGVVLADGSIADVKLDLDTLETLSKVARDDYGLAGAVQHGASTLPDTAFHNFPKRETAEIHLATNFQNMLFDHMPDALRARDLRVAQDEREGRAQGDRLRRAVLLQDAQEGDRAVQAALLGSAGRRRRRSSPRRTTRSSRFLFDQLAIGNTADDRGEVRASAPASIESIRRRRSRWPPRRTTRT